MSHGRDARRKAKRQEARAAQPEPQKRPVWPRRLVTAVPAFVIAATLAVVGVAGFGASTGVSKEQARREVAALLSGVPQDGATLGSPRAPVTLFVYADPECPTVRTFVVSYLPSIVATWVRTGVMKLEYRPLQTDTESERTFFKQETAALAAGRQDRMWTFLLTFVHEQGQHLTEYATEAFLSEIGAQVPGLNRAQWRRDREDPSLAKQVALGMHSAQLEDLRFTPSFLIGLTRGKVDQRAGFDDPASLRKRIERSLRRDVGLLREEAAGDVPTVGLLGRTRRG